MTEQLKECPYHGNDTWCGDCLPKCNRCNALQAKLERAREALKKIESYKEHKCPVACLMEIDAKQALADIGDEYTEDDVNQFLEDNKELMEKLED